LFDNRAKDQDSGGLGIGKGEEKRKSETPKGGGGLREEEEEENGLDDSKKKDIQSREGERHTAQATRPPSVLDTQHAP